MDTAGSKMDLNLALGFQIFRVEHDFMVLLFALGFDKERIP